VNALLNSQDGEFDECSSNAHASVDSVDLELARYRCGSVSQARNARSMPQTRNALTGRKPVLRVRSNVATSVALETRTREA